MIIPLLKFIFIHIPRQFFYFSRWNMMVKTVTDRTVPQSSEFSFLVVDKSSTEEDKQFIAANFPTEFLWFLPPKQKRSRILKRLESNVPCCCAKTPDGEFVGMIWLAPFEANVLAQVDLKESVIQASEVTNLYVTPTYQGKGVSTLLLEFAESYASSKGISHLVSSIWPERKSSNFFHLKNGFKIFGIKRLIRLFGKSLLCYQPNIDYNLILAKHHPNIVIVGRANPNLLAHIRSLRHLKANISVVLLRGETSAIAKTSRYVKNVYDLRKPDSEQFEAVMEKIVEQIPEGDHATLYVTNESDFQFLKALPESVASRLELINDVSSNLKITSKNEQNAIAETSGIPVPETVVLTRDTAKRENLSHLRFPVLTRPSGSVNKGKFAAKFIVSESLQHLEDNVFPLITEDTELLCQTFIEGTFEDVWFVEACVNQSGSVYSSVSGHKIREFPLGLMSAGKSENNVPLVRYVEDFCVNMKARGILGFEFIYDVRTGDYFFIEVNLRADNFVDLARRSNVNVIEHAFLVANGLEKLVIPWKPRHAIWFDFLADSAAIMKSSNSLTHRISEVLKMIGNISQDSSLSLRDPFPGLIWHAQRALSFVTKGS